MFYRKNCNNIKIVKNKKIFSWTKFYQNLKNVQKSKKVFTEEKCHRKKIYQFF